MQTDKPFSRILCAADLSDAGRAAFQRALSLAKAHGAVLSLVFAIPRSVRFNWRALERIRLMAEFRRIAVEEGVSVSISAQQGDPAGIILLHARARKHDAIVIGMPDQTALERLRFGSIAERVIAGAPCPTFVVRSGGDESNEDAFRHILCPVNVSPASDSVVTGAMKLLRRGGQKLTLLHVGPLHHAGTARRQLQQLASARIDLGGKVHGRLAGGPVASGILDVASELKPDLIVLGITRSGMWRWFNSLTIRIVRGAPCPVLAWWISPFPQGRAHMSGRDALWPWCGVRPDFSRVIALANPITGGGRRGWIFTFSTIATEIAALRGRHGRGAIVTTQPVLCARRPTRGTPVSNDGWTRRERNWRISTMFMAITCAWRRPSADGHRRAKDLCRSKIAPGIHSAGPAALMVSLGRARLRALWTTRCGSIPEL